MNFEDNILSEIILTIKHKEKPLIVKEKNNVKLNVISVNNFLQLKICEDVIFQLSLLNYYYFAKQSDIVI